MMEDVCAETLKPGACLNPTFWRNKKVLITGHTGFKGAWMSLWLSSLGAHVIGYSLDPPTTPSLFECAEVESGMVSVIGDIRDYDLLKQTLKRHKPEIVFHLAAQALVLRSYEIPIETYDVNVRGTAHVLEAVRQVGETRVLVIITSDKCYRIERNSAPFKETDALGGYDPYSSSKACAELVVAAYRASYLNSVQPGAPLIATARAGNVIGGGDWAPDRLLPDMIRAIMKHTPVSIRNPHSTRPWQHVLEPLGGYLLLAEKLWQGGTRFAEPWNFGPVSEAAPVVEIIEQVIRLWGEGASWIQDAHHFPHETQVLRLDVTKAMENLDWKPCWTLSQALEATVAWYKACVRGEDVRQVIFDQLDAYQHLVMEQNRQAAL
jgi:CDP-glucose 4,6-dehydratase